MGSSVIGTSHAGDLLRRAALGAWRDAPNYWAVPAEATIRRTLGRLDAHALAAAVGAWLADRQRPDRSNSAGHAQRGRPRQRAVAIDGKTLRGAFDSGFKSRPKSDAGMRELPLAPLVIESIRRQLPPDRDPELLVYTGPGGGNGVRWARARCCPGTTFAASTSMRRRGARRRVERGRRDD